MDRRCFCHCHLQGFRFTFPIHFGSMQSPGIVELLDFCDCTASVSGEVEVPAVLDRQLAADWVGRSLAPRVSSNLSLETVTASRVGGMMGFQCCSLNFTKLQERFLVVVARSSSRRLRRRGPYSEEVRHAEIQNGADSSLTAPFPRTSLGRDNRRAAVHPRIGVFVIGVAAQCRL